MAWLEAVSDGQSLGNYSYATFVIKPRKDFDHPVRSGTQRIVAEFSVKYSTLAAYSG